MAAGISSGVEVGGRWRLGGQLGQGAFGRVFRADDTSTLNLGAAAVKVLHPSTSPKEREAFHEEIRKVVSLRHPNLVAYLDSGEHRDDDGQPHLFLVTEVCQYSLQAYLAGGAGHLTAGQCERLLADMSAGLGYLHSRGLLHRDLKPANVLLGGDDWKLGDFGLTRAMSATGHYHHGTVVMGTPRYMAPELFEDGAASAASDVYAVGVTLHQALTGRTVHDGTDVALLVQVTTTPPKIDRDLPPHWRRLIEQCLERDPANRPGASQLPAVLAESRLQPSSRLAQLSGTSPLAKHLGHPLPPPPASAQALHPSAQPGPASAVPAPTPAGPGPAQPHSAAPPTRALRPAGAGSPAAGAPTSDDAGLAFGVPSAAWAAPTPSPAPSAPVGPPANLPRSPAPGPTGSGGSGPNAPDAAAGGPTASVAGGLNHPVTSQPVGSDEPPVGAVPSAFVDGSGGGRPRNGGRRLALIGALGVVALVLAGVIAFVATDRGGDDQPSDTTGPTTPATDASATTARTDAAPQAALRVAAVVAGPSDAPAGFNVEDTTARPPVDLCPGVNRAKVTGKALATRAYNFTKAGQLIVPVTYIYAGAPEAEAAFGAAQEVLAACDGKDLGPDSPGESWTMTPVSDVTIDGAVQTSATIMQVVGGPGAGPTFFEAALAIYARIDDVLVYVAGTDRASVIWYAQLMVARVNQEVPPAKVEPIGDVGTVLPGPNSEVRLAAADPAAGVSAEVTEWLAGHPNTDLDAVAGSGCEALGPVTAAKGVAVALQQAWDDLAINVRAPLTAADHAQLMAVAAPRYCPDEATRLGLGQP
ncbi:MAG: serine/threonine-protein kinase [Acidimicrobiales bacterium]